jgi:hypothetical protein
MSVDNNGGHNGLDGGAEVQSPNWEEVARSEFSVRVREQGDDLRNAFYKTATLLNDGHEVESEDLEALRSELRYKRTFVEESLTNAATYAPEDGVERVRALEWEMLQFYQLLASEISRGALSEEAVGHRMKEFEAMGEQLEQLLHDVQEGGDE